MPIRTILRETIPEGTTPTITALIKDASGVAIPSTSFATLTLTISDLMSPTLALVNEVDAEDILNTGRGTVDLNGLLTLTLTEDDTESLYPTKRLQQRVLLLEWSYGISGEKVGRAEILVTIENLAHVP